MITLARGHGDAKRVGRLDAGEVLEWQRRLVEVELVDGELVRHPERHARERGQRTASISMPLMFVSGKNAVSAPCVARRRPCASRRSRSFSCSRRSSRRSSR